MKLALIHRISELEGQWNSCCHSPCKGGGVPWEGKNCRSWSSYAYLRIFRKGWDYPCEHLEGHGLVPKCPHGIDDNGDVPFCHQMSMIYSNLLGKVEDSQFLSSISCSRYLYKVRNSSSHMSLGNTCVFPKEWSEIKSLYLTWFSWCVLYCVEMISNWVTKLCFHLAHDSEASRGLCLVSEL